MLLKRANTSADHLKCRTSKGHEMLKRGNASDNLLRRLALLNYPNERAHIFFVFVASLFS